MVNYCCVYGCGRNSRLYKHLNYYSLPKERHRQIEWLKAAGREDLLVKIEEKAAASYRFCSRHFLPSSVKNRHLSPDALPTLCLPGNCSEEDIEIAPAVHNDIICDNCSKPIMGFRYKCVNCDDYDLCQKCEMQEAHPDHFMLRLPKPLKYKLADNLINKWRKLFKSAHILPNQSEDVSSDDEPITKYSKDYDSGVDLSEDVKQKIRNEIDRALKDKSVNADQANITDHIKTKRKRSKILNGQNKRTKTSNANTGNDISSKVPICNDQNEGSVHGLVFADVNEVKGELEPNSESQEHIQASNNTLDTAELRILQMKLSDDLSQLMIEMSNNES